jgi:tight adherence protein C
MPGDTALAWTAFVAASSLVLLLFLVIGGRRSRLTSRLQDLASRGQALPDQDPVAVFARSALPKMGAALLPRDEEDRTRLQTRLIQAGYYGQQAMVYFLGVKMILIVAPALLGLAAGLLGFLPVRNGLIFGALLGIFGLIGPSFWLDRRKAKRQLQFRRALPDALDVLVICVEGGLSLAGSVRRVASELQTAHPPLAAELNIVQRELNLGLTIGEALHRFAERCDLDEVRTLASVTAQAERYGASLARALRIHAETLRSKRLLHAEEMAQKAAVKILFPTIFFIFPGIFIVVLGPAVIQLVAMFAQMRR